jgi:hypothetical protein
MAISFKGAHEVPFPPCGQARVMTVSNRRCYANISEDCS